MANSTDNKIDLSDEIIFLSVILLIIVFITTGSVLYNYFDQKQDYKHEVVMYQLDHPTACPAGGLE